ncbi:thiamine pyrophosphate-dependent enzyme [Candidatus Pelagibacter sp.]|nr:thiamine pyrophosphate-dependent enzyme [Candidatus Pelagibacter sp.]
MFQNQLSKIRYSILESCYRIREGHIGSAFSVLEILFVIFRKYFKNNYFILSKGHAAIGVYAVMNHLKILKDKDYRSFCNFNSKLGGHPDSTKLPNFNFSTGSLGHGLPVSTGLAFSLKKKKDKKCVICLIGDQELMEGTTWESLHIIDNYKLKNILLIIDRNNSDFRSIKFLNLKKKLSVFCDKITEINGHDIKDIEKSISRSIKKKKSFEILIANTIKGKGIKIIENDPAWHHRAPTKKELEIFKKELDI